MSFPTPLQIDALSAVSAAQLLKLIDLQIATILVRGQAVTDDGRTLTRADLDSLRRTRADIAPLADAEAVAQTDRCGAIGGVLIPRYPNDP